MWRSFNTRARPMFEEKVRAPGRRQYPETEDRSERDPEKLESLLLGLLPTLLADLDNPSSKPLDMCVPS